MQASEKPLDSWKEIAAYFGKTVRTVQYWEKEKALPVRRLGKRVQAYPSELERWRRRSLGRGRIRRLAGRVAWILTLGTALIAAWLSVRDESRLSGHQLAGFREISNEVIRIASEGDSVVEWSIPAADLDVDWYLSHHASTDRRKVRDQPYWIETLDQSKPRLWFVAKPIDTDRSDRLICFSSTGTILWERPFGRRVVEHVGDPEKARVFDTYSGAILGTVRDGSDVHLVTRAFVRSFYATRITLTDPRTGVPQEEFWHPGRFFDFQIVDLDGDSKAELLFGGINNPGDGLGHGALWALRVPFSAAGTQPEDFFGNHDSPRPWRYRLFAAPDALLVAGKHAGVNRLRLRAPERRIELDIGSMPHRVFHYLDFEFHPVRSVVADDLRLLHATLLEQGALKHALLPGENIAWGRSQAFEIAPDGNDADLTAELDHWPDNPHTPT